LSNAFLNGINAQSPISLYIHIPFCRKRCSYCAFYSTEGHGSVLRQSFASKLINELLEIQHLRKEPFETVFIGGGNPGCLAINDLVRIVQIICHKGKPKEFSIEMNPESLTEAHFPLFSMGINRLSMGVQSLNPSHLKTLGRQANLEDTLYAIELAKSLRVQFQTHLNFDLMTCIPGQSVQDSIDDINELVQKANPEHISLYSLTFEEGTKLADDVRSHVILPIEDDEQAHMLFSCWRRLGELGYEQYEVSNFARNSAYCLHNLRYWDLQEYVGIGPSAAGTLFAHQGLNRWKGHEDVLLYTESPEFTHYEHESISKEEELTEYLLVALRTKWGIDKQSFHTRFKLSFSKIFGDTVVRLQKNFPECIDDDAAHFSLNRKGWMLLDSIILEMAMDCHL
jgi:oxygen-independent coproporphyrinogen III oxidase